MPKGLEPLVVLDASGREGIRATYAKWQNQHGGIKMLASAAKSYKNLTVHCWNTSGGKSAFRRDGKTLLEGVVKTIKEQPTEPWLVIYHHDGIGMDFRAEVEKRIAGKTRVEFLHWGEHQATNCYSHIPNVILAGTLFLRLSYYEALTRMMLDQRPTAGPVDIEAEQAITQGEHRHLVLQALCRGNVRRCQGAECYPCDAYVIASVNSGIRKALPEIFPDCKVVDWQPVPPPPLRGKVKEALAFIDAWFEENPNGVLRFTVLQKKLGMKPKEFRWNVRRHPSFVEAITSRGIIETTVGRSGGFIKPF